MHIYAALASGEQNLCILTQLSLPGSRICVYLRSSRFRGAESMHIYTALPFDTCLKHFRRGLDTIAPLPSQMHYFF